MSPVDGTSRPCTENNVTAPVPSWMVTLGLSPGEAVAATKETVPSMTKGMPDANSSSESALISAAVRSNGGWASAVGRSKQSRIARSVFKVWVFYHIPRLQRD